jgi:hypothetical protein
MPPHTVEANFSLPFQVLLRVPNIVLPPLAEVDAVDDSIHRIVAQVRVEELDPGVNLLCPKGALGKEEFDCI